MNYSNLELATARAKDMSIHGVISKTFSVWEKRKTNKARVPRFIVNVGDEKEDVDSGYVCHSTWRLGVKIK